MSLYPAKITTSSGCSDINLFNSFNASCPKLSFSSRTIEYASSINKTFPSSSVLVSNLPVLSLVCPTYCPTKSGRLTILIESSDRDLFNDGFSGSLFKSFIAFFTPNDNNFVCLTFRLFSVIFVKYPLLSSNVCCS